MATNHNNTPKTNRVMNPEMLAKRAAILAEWQKKEEMRAQAEATRRAERLSKLMLLGYSESEARLVMAAEDNPCDSISSII